MDRASDFPPEGRWSPLGVLRNVALVATRAQSQAVVEISSRMIGCVLYELGDGTFRDADVPSDSYESDPTIRGDAFDEPERNVQ